MSNPVYLSRDEILAVVSKVIEDSIEQSNYKWHPEDAYYNVEVAIKSAFSALSQLAYMRHPKKETFNGDTQF